MKLEIDQLLETASSLSVPELSAFLKTLPKPQREEIELILDADCKVRSRNLLEPVIPHSVNIAKPQPSIQLDSLSSYELQKQIGSGGMGEVFLAIHPRLRRKVAIKILQQANLQDNECVTRFNREMEAIGQLHHPNIVQAFDAGTENNHHFLVLEYVEGLDGKQLVNGTGPLRCADACEITRQTALALAYAHEKEFVHRDIKPSNLLISRSGVVKVADLGLAQFPRREELTHTGAFMGTPDYVSPEQIENSKKVDSRTDLYSLGCTLYFLLAGRAPFDTDEYPTLLNKINAQSKLAPTQFNSSLKVPKKLQGIIMQLLEKNPVDRLQTATEVVDLLEPFAHDSDLATLIESTLQLESNRSSNTETIFPQEASTARNLNNEEASESKDPLSGISPALLRKSNPVAQSQGKRAAIGKRLRWRIVAAILVGSAFLAYGVAANWLQIVRVVTAKGVLVLENTGDDFEVMVTQGDHNIPVRLVDKTLGKEYELSIGKNYRVRVTDPKTGTTFESKDFSISRNGKTIVAVSAGANATNSKATNSEALSIKPESGSRELVSSKELIEWGYKNGLDGIQLTANQGASVWIGSEKEIPEEIPPLSSIASAGFGVTQNKSGQAAALLRKFRKALPLGHVTITGNIAMDAEFVEEFNLSDSKLLAIHVPVTNDVIGRLSDEALDRMIDIAFRNLTPESEVNDATVKLLSEKCDSLQRLTLVAKDLGPDSIALIKKLDLRQLALTHPNATVMKTLNQLTNLSELDLVMAPTAKIDFSNLPPNLKTLRVEPEPPTGQQLETLRHMKELKKIVSFQNGRFVEWIRENSVEPFSMKVSAGKKATRSPTETDANDKIGF